MSSRGCGSGGLRGVGSGRATAAGVAISAQAVRPPRPALLPPCTVPRTTRTHTHLQVFAFKWSVNWAFLPEPIFLAPQLALLLLWLHLRLLWSLAQKHWWVGWPVGRPMGACSARSKASRRASRMQPWPPPRHAPLPLRRRRFVGEGGTLPALRAFLAGGGTQRQAQAAALRNGRGSGGGKASSKGSSGGGSSFEDEALFLVFSANFAGIATSRTLHYQFYSW